MKTLSFQVASVIAACFATACLTAASSSAPAKAATCYVGVRA